MKKLLKILNPFIWLINIGGYFGSLPTDWPKNRKADFTKWTDIKYF
jgi:hypothetical protein